jgi:hypothetical protein
MLGWSFSVSVPEIVDSRKCIAYWEGGLWSDKWLTDALANEEADVLSKSGGYPDRYIVRTAVLPNDKVPNKPEVEWCVVEVWDQS